MSWLSTLTAFAVEWGWASLAFTVGWILAALMAHPRGASGVHDLDAAYWRGYDDGLAEMRRRDETATLERMWGR